MRRLKVLDINSGHVRFSILFLLECVKRQTGINFNFTSVPFVFFTYIKAVKKKLDCTGIYFITEISTKNVNVSSKQNVFVVINGCRQRKNNCLSECFPCCLDSWESQSKYLGQLKKKETCYELYGSTLTKYWIPKESKDIENE